MTGNSDCPWFCRVVILTVAAFDAGEAPTSSYNCLITSRTFIKCDRVRATCWREEVIIRGVAALRFRVFVRLVARVISRFSAVRVDTLDRGYARELTLPGIARDIHQQPRN